jgi:hypothetical protein
VSSSLDIVYEEFITINKKQWESIYNNNTKDYNFLVVCCDSVKTNDELFSIIKNYEYKK